MRLFCVVLICCTIFAQPANIRPRLGRQGPEHWSSARIATWLRPVQTVAGARGPLATVLAGRARFSR